MYFTVTSARLRGEEECSMKNVERRKWNMIVIKVLRVLNLPICLFPLHLFFLLSCLSLFDVFLVCIGQCSCGCPHVLV